MKKILCVIAIAAITCINQAYAAKLIKADATSIAEDVIYAVEAKVVKHHQEKL